MLASGIEEFRRSGVRALPPGPVALILADDIALLPETLRHLLGHGFGAVLLLAPDHLDQRLPDPRVHLVRHDVTAPGALSAAANALMPALEGRWIYVGHGAEFPFYPFCETRSIGELLSFHESERRMAMLSYVVDVYAGDLERAPDGADIADAWMDARSYYALPRPDAERQIEAYGGLRWRYEEHIPADRRRIDRIAFFKARPGLAMAPDFTLSEAEANTYACEWHHSATAAIVSFRAARALRSNPGPRAAIRSFRWHGSVKFDWTSQQLLDLGLMEPGQWF